MAAQAATQASRGSQVSPPAFHMMVISGQVPPPRRQARSETHQSWPAELEILASWVLGTAPLSR